MLTHNISGYRLTEQLYDGSKTVVYRGQREVDNKPVVIKLLKNPYPNFMELLQFRNQYSITKNLEIPLIVRPLCLETYQNAYALVMEDFGGISLREWLTNVEKTHVTLPLHEFLTIALQLTDILDGLYRNRIIHKDIKPANILIHPETKQVKLIDFSIASLLPRETQEKQNPNILEGTLAYLSPEQTGRMNRGIDYRADFYALGITFYELLTGKLPFEVDDAMELVHCHLAKNPISVSEINSEIPLVVSKIIDKLMAKNAEDRYQSALGLKSDLENCLCQLKQTGKISDFAIAQLDVSDSFVIPEKLYGREQEVQTLLSAFDRVAEGNTELMLVAGFSGIGKTAVINEVHKPIVRQRGYFIKGKYDQFQRNIPLSAVLRAFRDLMVQLLSESGAEFTRWKTDILEVVGENGQLLIDVIPELEYIIGSQPPVIELSGTAAQNRFNLLFQKLINIFTTPAHPLVIFLDDLQWADVASLKLLQLLLNDAENLLILGAYRDNEVSATHPLMLTIDEINKAGAIVGTITLQPLSLEDTNQLVADTLNCSNSVAEPLTELVVQKTKGNPFFTTQFLKALYQDGLIVFNRLTSLEKGESGVGGWQCDIAQIRRLALTDDVVKFMATQLQKLPQQTQEKLKLAACIGAQFNLQTLAIVLQQTEAETAADLWKALQESFILPTNEVYRFYQSNYQSSCELSITQAEVTPTYRFLHDRIQQAAYSLIPESHKQITHLQIGQLLLRNTSKSEQDEIFEIVNQLNIGAKLLSSTADQEELAQLNFRAAQKAKSATAYEAAATYLQVCLDLLGDNCWQKHYAFTLDITTEAAEVALLMGNFHIMEQHISGVINNAKILLDTLKVYETKVSGYIIQQQPAEALKTALIVLEKLGLEFPEFPTPEDIQFHIAETMANVGESIASLINLAEMTSPSSIAISRLLAKVLSPAYIAKPMLLPILLCKSINLFIQEGNASAAAFVYSYFGSVLCIGGNIPDAYEFGELALQMSSKFDCQEYYPRAVCSAQFFIRHWQIHVKETIKPLLESYHMCLESGDLEFAAWSVVNYCCYSYFVGYELSNLQQQTKTYAHAIAHIKQEAAFSYTGIFQQAMLNLLENNVAWSELEGEGFSEAKTLPIYHAVNDQLGLLFIYLNKLILSYLFGEVEEAIANDQQAAKYSSAAASCLCTPLFYFYDSLVQLMAYSQTPLEERASLLQRITTNQTQMEQWAYYAPMNHLHKWHLVEAEKYRVLDNWANAINHYDCAILGAKENGYVNEQALAEELAAKFYLNWGKEKVAAGYMQEAYYCYARWGAKAKVQQLENLYPSLLAPILQLRQITTANTVKATTYPTISAAATTDKTSSSISRTLDLATVLKASQTLSSEIELEKLLAALLQIVMENAGADKGALVMPRNELWVEAIAVLEQPTRVKSTPLAESFDVPIALIRRVRHSKQPVVIANATADSDFAVDPYVLEKRPNSILCTPIVHQGKLVAILYLENRLVKGAFTVERVELLNLLCAQAAISLDNARLYAQEQEKSQKLEQALKDLQQAQLQIVQSEKMSALGNLVAGVAHEINNPVGYLAGNIQPALDYTQDLFGLLDLYQEKFPNPGQDIEDEIETIDLGYLRQDLPKLIDSMKLGVDRIKAISTSLRTFSRADSDYPFACNLHDGINSTILILKHRLKANENRPAIEVISNYGNLPQVTCFPGQLNQVFMNLLANAIDALEEFNTGRSFADIQANPNRITITTQFNSDTKQISISIKDNGVGMSEEVKQKIFDHLFTTKAVGTGTGLGLTIARQIVEEKHRGKLHCISVVGEGTEFIIEIPAYDS